MRWDKSIASVHTELTLSVAAKIEQVAARSRFFTLYSLHWWPQAFRHKMFPSSNGELDLLVKKDRIITARLYIEGAG